MRACAQWRRQTNFLACTLHRLSRLLDSSPKAAAAAAVEVAAAAVAEPQAGLIQPQAELIHAARRYSVVFKADGVGEEDERIFTWALHVEEEGEKIGVYWY